MHPYALDLLRKLHYDVTGLRSKSWTEFAGRRRAEARFRLHRLRQRRGGGLPGVAGPADDRALGRARSRRATGTEAEIRLAFADSLRMLTNRINIFVSLPLRSLDQLSLQKQLDAIGTAKNNRHGGRMGRRRGVAGLGGLMGEAPAPLPRRLLAEGLGTALLLAAVVGSGIMAERLAGGNAAHRASLQHPADRRHSDRDHHHFRPGLRRAFQSGGVAGLRGARRVALARGRALYRRAMRRRHRRHLVAHLMFDLAPWRSASAAMDRRNGSPKPSPRSGCC